MATNDKLTAATIRRDLATMRGMIAGATVLVQTVDVRLADLTSCKGWEGHALPGPDPASDVSVLLQQIGQAHGYLDLMERLLLTLEGRFEEPNHSEPHVPGGFSQSLAAKLLETMRADPDRVWRASWLRSQFPTLIRTTLSATLSYLVALGQVKHVPGGYQLVVTPPPEEAPDHG